MSRHHPILLSGESFHTLYCKEGNPGGVEQMELGSQEDEAARVLRIASQRGDCCTERVLWICTELPFIVQLSIDQSM